MCIKQNPLVVLTKKELEWVLPKNKHSLHNKTHVIKKENKLALNSVANRVYREGGPTAWPFFFTMLPFSSFVKAITS